MTKRILHLTLFAKWFTQIMNGEKTEEYRTLTPYWRRRLEGREYDEVHFTNGYGRHRPFMRVEYKGLVIDGQYRIQLGKVLETRNTASSAA